MHVKEKQKISSKNPKMLNYWMDYSIGEKVKVNNTNKVYNKISNNNNFINSTNNINNNKKF